MNRSHPSREVEKWFQEAFHRHEKGDFAGAQVLYQKILTHQPLHAQVLFLLGTLESQSGSYALAHEHLSRALELRPNWPEALNNLGLTAARLSHWDEAETILRRALVARPNYSDALNNLADVVEKQGHLEDSMALYQQAITFKPKDANIHYNLGLLLKRLARIEEAALSFERALVLNPKHFDACNTLATIYKTLDRLADAERWLRRALELHPNYHDAHNNLGAVFQAQDRLEEALTEYGRALALRPDDPLVQWNRAFILLALGRLHEGWDAYEWRRRVFNWQPLPFPEWNGADLTGKTLLVFAEQGLGDELLFASCFPELIERAGHCILECNPRLAPLYQRSFPRATVIGVPRIDRAWLQNLPPIDLQIPAGSIPRQLRPTLESFPKRISYLSADPAATERWRVRLAALGPGLKVGITWRSILTHEGRHRHYSRLNEWGAVFAVSGVHFINLQYDECREELAVARRLFNVEIHAFPELDLFNDLDGAAALSAALDLVIAAGNAAGEIAATLGVPVWRLESYGRSWTALGSNAFPWHPRLKIFQQDQHGEDWSAVLGRVAAALNIHAANHAWSSGHLAEAEIHYQQILAEDPTSPSAHNNLGSLFYAHGRIDEAEHHYRAALAAHAAFPEAHYNLANVLHQKGQWEAAVAEYHAALALRPAYAEAYSNLGRTLQEMGCGAEVETALQHALAQAPDLPEAHNNLGTLRHSQDRLDEAVACYQRALTLHPAFPNALYNLANVLRELGRVTDAEPFARRALELAPHDDKAALVLADVLQDLNRFDEALTYYERLTSAEARRNRAFCLLAAGKLAAGWAAYTERWELLKPLTLPYPEWNGAENLSTQAIVVLPEQGLGDELLFASCLPDLIARAGQCLVMCEPRLVTLYARSFPKATIFPAGPDAVPPWPAGSQLNTWQVRSGDLPRYFRSSLDQFPLTPGYLIPDPQRVALWRVRLAALGNGAKIGITWRSGLLSMARRRYYTELTQWAPLWAVPGIIFVNLQYDDCATELATAREHCGVAIHNFPHLNLKNDLEEVAALAAALDLIIGVGNATIGLAAALGITPVWRLDTCGQSWISLGTPALPWHPQVELFKQPRWGDWETVFTLVAERLREKYGPPPALAAQPPSINNSAVLEAQPEVEEFLIESPAPAPEPLVIDASPAPESERGERIAAIREHLRAGRTSHVQHDCRNYLTDHPDDPVVLDLFAATCDDAPAEALAALRRAVALAPRNALYHGHLANILTTLGQNDEAIAALRTALTLEPHWAQAHNDLGNLLRAAGQMAEAERCYLSALRYKSDLVEAHNNLGTVLESQGRRTEAEAAYRGALRLRAHFPEAWYNLGNCLGDLGRWSEAEAAYREALALRPDYDQAWFELGTALHRQGQLAAAEAAYRAALALRPNWAQALNLLANLINGPQRWSEAATLYRSALALTPDSPELHSNLGNCLLLGGHSAEGEAACRAAVRLAPNFAAGWNNLGNALRSLERPAESEQSFRSALALDSRLADAHSNLGCLLRELDRLDEAEFHDRQAVALRPDMVGVWLNLGNTLNDMGKLDEAEQCFERARSLGCDPAIVSLGKLRYEQGRLAEAITCMREGIQRCPDNPEMHWNLAMPLLARGELEEGWNAYEWGRLLPKKKGRRQEFHYFPEWDGSPLAGRTILVYAEQGLGDEILFASCLPELFPQAGYCLVECDLRLRALYIRSFPTASIIARNREDQDWLTELVEVEAVDVEVPIGTLPRFLRRSLADFPQRAAYLIPDPERVAHFAHALAGPELKVGITWRSKIRDKARSRNYSNLEDWGAIFAVPGIKFVNLQYDDCALELAAARAKFGKEIIVFPDLDLMNDLDGAAALSASLDLVIAPGNAAAEIAAAVGVPVWRLDIFGCSWTSLGTDGFPWHPRMKIFRQTRPGDWIEVIERIAAALPALTLEDRGDKTNQSASDLYQQGMKFQEQDKFDEAAACYQKALQLQPDFIEVLNNYGVLLRKRGQNSAAQIYYQIALDLRPDLFETRYNLANLLQEEGDPVKAEEYFRICLSNGVDKALLWNGLALAVRDQGRIEEALVCFQEALKRDPTELKIKWNMGLAYLAMGDLVRGWAGYEDGYHVMRRTLREFEFSDWDGRYIPDATLLIYAEQGVGDEILFTSCLADVLPRVGYCVLECDARLATLIARSFPAIQVFGVMREDRAWLNEIDPQITWQCPIGSLAYYFRRSLESFPRRPGYLLPDPLQRANWRKRLAQLDEGKSGATIKVGISWRSRLTGGGRARFYSRLTQWNEIFLISGVTFINLQYDDCSAELAEVAERFGIKVVQFPELDLLNDLDGVAALAGALDLVIATSNSVASLAAAIGAEVWRLDAALPNWTLLGTNFMPWHPTMRIFRQKQLGDWTGPLQAVATELSKRAALAALNKWIEPSPATLFPASEKNELGEKIGQLIAQLVPPQAMVVLIGANDENIIQAVAQAVGEKGRMLIYEERPGPFRRLQANLLRHGFHWVKYRPERIGDKIEELPAWRACPWDLMVSANPDADLRWANALVPCRTIDSIGLTACDLLIIDVEGREMEILAGAWQTLERYRPLLYLGRYRHEASAWLIDLLGTHHYQSLAQEISVNASVLLAYPIVPT